MMADLTLTAPERTQLRHWASGAETARLAVRARIVLAAADGLGNAEIATGLRVHRNTVGAWRGRFAAERLPGLRDRPRSGRPSAAARPSRQPTARRPRRAPRPSPGHPRTSEPVEMRRARFRRRLLDGLAASIREKGLGQTQIADIVQRAHTSKSTFYASFADKQSCFVELVEEWNAETLRAVRAALRSAASWEEQIERAVDAYLGALAADPAIAVAVTRELPALGVRGAALHRSDIDRYARLLVEMTAGEAMDRAGVKPLASDVAVMLVGGIGELVDRRIRAREPAQAVAATVKLVVKRVIAPGVRPSTGIDRAVRTGRR